MDAGFTLAFARRRVPTLLAGTALAAASAAAAESIPTQFNVGVVIQPSCAVAAPSRLRPDAAGRQAVPPADMLEIACTNGASWSVISDEMPGDTLVLATGEAVAGPRSARPLGLGTMPEAEVRRPRGGGDARTVVRVTVRY